NSSLILYCTHHITLMIKINFLIFNKTFHNKNLIIYNKNYNFFYKITPFFKTNILINNLSQLYTGNKTYTTQLNTKINIFYKKKINKLLYSLLDITKKDVTYLYSKDHLLYLFFKNIKHHNKIYKI